MSDALKYSQVYHSHDDPFRDVLDFTNDTETNINKKYSSMCFIDRKDDNNSELSTQCPYCHCPMVSLSMNKDEAYCYVVFDGTCKVTMTSYMNRCLQCQRKWYKIRLPHCAKCDRTGTVDMHHHVSFNTFCTNNSHVMTFTENFVEAVDGKPILGKILQIQEDNAHPKRRSCFEKLISWIFPNTQKQKIT